MNHEKYARVRPIYDEAVQQPAVERTNWVTERCGDDLELAAAVLTLLAASDKAGARFDAGGWRIAIPKSQPE